MGVMDISGLFISLLLCIREVARIVEPEQLFVISKHLLSMNDVTWIRRYSFISFVLYLKLFLICIVGQDGLLLLKWLVLQLRIKFMFSVVAYIAHLPGIYCEI